MTSHLHLGEDEERARHIVERHPLGATVAANLVTEWTLRQVHSPHNMMPMVIALQYWAGDKQAAFRLAKLLADIEPRLRDDVLFAFCARYDCPLDLETRDALDYVARSFPVTFMRSRREAIGHPDGSFGLWAGTADNCYRRWRKKWHMCTNVFFCEPDGVPARWDWIDALKDAHQRNLTAGKRITGARMDIRHRDPHVNGTLAMHISAWADHPSWHSCPSNEGWDCVCGQSMLADLGPVGSVFNLYGAHDVSLSVFKTLGYMYSWIASVKDDSAFRCAQTLAGDEWRKLAASVGKMEAS